MVRQLSISRRPSIHRIGESASCRFRERVVANGDIGKDLLPIRRLRRKLKPAMVLLRGKFDE